MVAMTRSSTAESRGHAVASRIDAADVAAACVTVAVAAAATIGADSRWAAALGRTIAAKHSIPRGVPYASAPSSHWPNVPVLAELILHWLASFGDRGFLLVQVVAVGLAFVILALDMRRRGARELPSAIAMFLVAVGAGSTLFVIRIQLFSLVLFPLLALLLREETHSPSRRVWLVPVVLAVWSNLHGAVLIGLAVATAYLVFERARKRLLESALVFVVSLVAICATPALWRTPEYYRGVLQNEAARRGVGLWAPLSPSSKTDLALIATAVLLVGIALWKRPRLWEVVAFAGLAILTVRTARSGVWLLLFAAPPAAAAVSLQSSMRRPWPAVVVAALSIVLVYEVAIGPHAGDASPRLIAETVRVADGTPVLADSPTAEQVALGGGRVWMSNPLDAFMRRDQRLYLDWIDGRSDAVAAYAHAPRAVLVHRGSAADNLTKMQTQFRLVDEDASVALYVRR